MNRIGLENNATQTAKIVEFLRSYKGQWVPLPEILALRISQYSARIYEARHRWGLKIENRVETINGQKHSWFRLIEPSQDVPRHVPRLKGRGDYSTAALSHPPASLFGELAPESRYPD